MISSAYLRVLNEYKVRFMTKSLNYYPESGGGYRERMTGEELENYVKEPEYLGVPDFLDLFLQLSPYIGSNDKKYYLRILCSNTGVEVSYDGLFSCKSHSVCDVEDMLAMMLIKSKMGLLNSI